MPVRLKLKGIKGFGKKKKQTTGKTVSSLGARLRGLPSAMPRQVPAGRDPDAMRYLALLADPCNSALVPPTYAGEGSGLFVRTKNMFTVGSSAQDCVLQFCPSFLFYNDNGADGGFSPIEWGSTNTTGTPVSTIYAESVSSKIFGSATGAQQGIAGTGRCLAACVKVHYTGSELNRSGIVYAGLQNSPPLGQTGATTLSAANIGNSCPQIDRLGTRVHEYRWVPSFVDESFINLQQSTYNPASPFTTASGNTLVVAAVGFPSGSIMIEVTACWEYNVNMVQGAGLVTTANVCKSPSTLNDVLRTIGDVGKFALSPDGGKRIVAAVSGAVKNIRDVAHLGAAFASVLI
jgi:hypothetical protein